MTLHEPVPVAIRVFFLSGGTGASSLASPASKGFCSSFELMKTSRSIETGGSISCCFCTSFAESNGSSDAAPSRGGPPNGSKPAGSNAG